MGAVRHGYAVAYPKDAPLEFAALRAAAEGLTDEHLESAEYHDGKVDFDYYLDQAEVMLSNRGIQSYEQDGWVIWHHSADDWGDGGDEENRALAALCTALWLEGAPKPGAGGGLHVRTGAEGKVPDIADRDKWW